AEYQVQFLRSTATSAESCCWLPSDAVKLTVIVPLTIIGPLQPPDPIGPEFCIPDPLKLHEGELDGPAPVSEHETVPLKLTVEGVHVIVGGLGGGSPIVASGLSQPHAFFGPVTSRPSLQLVRTTHVMRNPHGMTPFICLLPI